jgi:hypothetical protein
MNDEELRAFLSIAHSLRRIADVLENWEEKGFK